MKSQNNIFYLLIILLIVIMFNDCTGSEDIINVENRLEDGRRLIHLGEIDFENVSVKKTAVVSRIVYYIDNQKMIINDETVQLGFVTKNKLYNTDNRLDDTLFYDVPINNEGYFMIELDKIPHSLIYIYLGIDDEIYIIPAGATIHLYDQSKIVYAGEIHIIKTINEISNKYNVDTYFEFYNNQYDAIDYLEYNYEVNPKNIEIIPFKLVDKPPMG